MSKPSDELMGRSIWVLWNNGISIEELMLLFFKTRSQVKLCLEQHDKERYEII